MVKRTAPTKTTKTTATTIYPPNQLHQVPLAELQPDPTQPRKYLDPVALEDLTASVGQVGIIEPIVCRQDPQTGMVYVINKLPQYRGVYHCRNRHWSGGYGFPRRELLAK